MTLDMTQANYNLAIATLRNLLNNDSKAGSATDISIMELARFIEDFEVSRKDVATFEPHYMEIVA